MFGLFKSQPFLDAQLGQLRRSGGAWRGTVTLAASGPVPLIIVGSRSVPDDGAIQLGRATPGAFPRWRPAIERALLDHFIPYAEARTAGDVAAPPGGVPELDDPASVWRHVTPQYVYIAPLDGVLTVEIGYRVTWDDEHTLGVRFRNGEFLELCGSVLPP